MYASRSDYDRGVNTFSPEGRLYQVEYALGAVKLGTTAIGIQTNEGVVLAVERRTNSILMENTANDKIWELDTHLGCAMSGLTADARTLVSHARSEAQNHLFTYDEPLSVESCVSAVSDLALDFSDVSETSGRKKIMSRPFGVALLFAGVDKQDGPQLWFVDPSGTYTRYHAASIGSGHEGAESMLQEQFHKQMSLEEAKTLSLVILRQVMEEKLSTKNVELAYIDTTEKKFKILKGEDLETLIQNLPAPAHPTTEQLASSSAQRT